MVVNSHFLRWTIKPSSNGTDLKGKNLLQKEQILSFLSCITQIQEGNSCSDFPFSSLDDKGLPKSEVSS